jgi:hypothetical protein
LYAPFKSIYRVRELKTQWRPLLVSNGLLHPSWLNLGLLVQNYKNETVSFLFWGAINKRLSEIRKS